MDSKVADSTDMCKGFLESWMDFNTQMMKSGFDALGGYCSSDSCEKFYKDWSTHYSDMMEKVMRLPGFTEKSWEAFKTTAGFQKFTEMMTRQYLASLNVPTREEIDELSERISYLDDRLESMEEKLDRALLGFEK